MRRRLAALDHRRLAQPDPSAWPITGAGSAWFSSTFLIFLATGMAFGLGWARAIEVAQNWRAAISWSMRRRTLVARVEARETLPRQDAPAPLSRRQVPTNVAVAVLPLLNDAKSVTEKVEVGRVAGKSRVDNVDGIGRDMVLQTRPRFLTGAAAQYQKCHKDCCCAAHRSATPRGRGSVFCFSADPGAAEARPARRWCTKARLNRSVRGGPAMPAPPAPTESPPDL